MRTWKTLETEVNVQPYVRNRHLHAYAIGGSYADYDFDPTALIQARLAKKQHIRLLDVGCGTGNALSDIASIFKQEIEQEKLSLAGIDRFVKRPKPHITCTNLFDYEPEKPFDIVLSLFCLPYIADKIRAIERIYNVFLAPGGEARISLVKDTLRIHASKDTTATRNIESFFKETSHDRRMRYSGNRNVLKDNILRIKKMTPARLTFPVGLRTVKIMPQGHCSSFQYLLSIYDEGKK